MTNFDRWRNFTDGLISPDSYINFGYYYLIASSLQRRVWTGPEHCPLYPNLYIILVGEPGVGKGLVIKQVSELLHFHKMPDINSKKYTDNTVTDADKKMMELIAKDDYDSAQHQENSGSKDSRSGYEKPLLFPVAADATTYEALVRSMSKAIRRINYKKFNSNTNQNEMGIYTHSSLCFCLEEISSLFRKRTEDLVHFLLQTYDCGDYTYDTKTQGKDRIRKCCLNFFGGTTPGFMQSTFDDQLLTEGFSSRTLFIFSALNRKTTLFIPELTQEQRECRAHILLQMERLSQLYGKVEVDDQTEAWLEDWWKNAQANRPNTSIKLNPYYARKNITLFKIAMAVHFSDSVEMKLYRQDFEQAMVILEQAESRMHLALGFDSSNPLSSVTKRICNYIEKLGMKTRRELLAEFWNALPKGNDDLDVVLEHLESTNKIKQLTVKHPVLKQELIYYDVTQRREQFNNASTSIYTTPKSALTPTDMAGT